MGCIAGKKREYRMFMVGLDGAGKTTVLYRLKLGDNVATIPTIGFNVETIEYQKAKFVLWDVGGQEKIRALWRFHMRDADGIVFVVDSDDSERLDSNPEKENHACDELHRILREDDLKEVPLLVLANKQDLPNACSVEEVKEKLRLTEIKDRVWNCIGCVATKGEGLYEGLDWLNQVLLDRK